MAQRPFILLLLGGGGGGGGGDGRSIPAESEKNKHTCTQTEMIRAFSFFREWKNSERKKINRVLRSSSCKVRSQDFLSKRRSAIIG